MITFPRQFGPGRHLTVAPELLFAAGLCTVQRTKCLPVQMVWRDQAGCTYEVAQLELLWRRRTPRAWWLFPQYLSACRKWGLNWNWFAQPAPPAGKKPDDASSSKKFFSMCFEILHVSLLGFHVSRCNHFPMKVENWFKSHNEAKSIILSGGAVITWKLLRDILPPLEPLIPSIWRPTTTVYVVQLLLVYYLRPAL